MNRQVRQLKYFLHIPEHTCATSRGCIIGLPPLNVCMLWWSCLFSATTGDDAGVAEGGVASEPLVLTTLEALQPAGGGDASAPTASAGSRCYIAWL